MPKKISKSLSGIQKGLLTWYAQHHRLLPWRRTNNPYYIWVSEVMLQQTQVATVEGYYQNFIKRFPSVKRLAQSDIQAVLKAWEGLGYYARARNLHRAAGVVIQKHQARIPPVWDAFRQLPGVGDYIAAAVLSIAFNLGYAVVDGNVKRVLSRLFEIDAPVNQSSTHNIFKASASRLLNHRQPGTHNQALMELGALVCKPKSPDCPACPLQSYCAAFRHGTVSAFPKRLKPKPLPEYHIAVGVVEKKGRLLITQRPAHGLLGGLWEFPGGKLLQDETPAAACLREIKEETNLTVEVDSHLTLVKHAYTHFKIRMDVFCCRYIRGRVRLRGPVAFRWIKLSALDQFPLPKANHKFIPLLKQRLQSF